jgi:hypothetical protein
MDRLRTGGRSFDEPFPIMDYQLLVVLQSAFTVWMLVDAYRRQVDIFWYWVILIPGAGAFVYFFVVKLPDFRLPGNLFGPRKPSLDELRYQAEQAPTLARDLALAEALVERNQHAEAMPHLESARKREPEHCQVLYLLALCHTEQGHPEKAIPLLETVLQRDRHWSDHAAWRLLVAARGQNGDGAGAVTTCRELVKLAPTLQYQCLLAERLLMEGQNDEARTLLDESLEAHRYSPGPIRRRNRRWARHAQKLQREAARTVGSGQ